MQIVVPTTDIGELMSRLYITVRSRSFAGAPFRRKVHDSITVLSAASGRARIDWIAPLMVRLG